MPKYVVERVLPGGGELTHEQLHGVAAKSCGVLRDMGSGVQWVQSYVTDDKIDCLYTADEGPVREHAKRGGFPADRVARVLEVIDPTTAE